MKLDIPRVALFIVCLVLAPVAVASESVRFTGSIEIEGQPATPCTRI